MAEALSMGVESGVSLVGFVGRAVKLQVQLLSLSRRGGGLGGGRPVMVKKRLECQFRVGWLFNFWASTDEREMILG